MENWYKKASRSKFTDPDTGHTIEGPEMDKLIPTELETIKMQLEEEFPRVNWTIEKVKEWINKTFIGKPKPFTGPKNKVHKF